MKTKAEIEKAEIAKRPAMVVSAFPFSAFSSMNRLQKKCVIATGAAHLLLLTILVVGPAFYNPKPKASNAQILTFISPNLIDGPSSGGRPDAVTPPPQPVVQQPQSTVQPPPPLPQPVQPPPKPVEPQRSFLSRLFTPEPVKPAPPKPPENQTPQIKINTQRVTRATSKNTATQPTPQRNTQAINSALKALEKNLSHGTVVDTPGNGGAASTNYKDALATIYYNAWVTPNDAANDQADVIVKITVARDGTVLTSRIITSSGDAKVDDSVQHALNQVSSLPALPDQSKAEQEFTIDFNLKTKRMSE